MAFFSKANPTAFPTIATSKTASQDSHRRLPSTTMDFFLVWRIETSPIDGVTDRAPTVRELDGVAEATVSWLTDTLPTLDTIDSGVSINTVTAAVATSQYNPNSRLPHSVGMDVQVTFDAASVSSLPRDMTTILSGIDRRDLSTFVYDYLRKSGLSNSLFQYSRDSATYVIQETSTGTTAPTPTPQLRATPTVTTVSTPGAFASQKRLPHTVADRNQDQRLSARASVLWISFHSFLI